MYACVCRAITEAEVREAGRAGVVDPGALVEVFGLDEEDCCGRCTAQVERLVALAWEGAGGGAPALRPPRMRPAFA